MGNKGHTYTRICVACGEPFQSTGTKEAICLALIRYKGSFPPYPRDLEDKVYDYDIEGVFMEGIRRVNEISKEEQLDGMREKIMEALQ